MVGDLSEAWRVVSAARPATPQTGDRSQHRQRVPGDTDRCRPGAEQSDRNPTDCQVVFEGDIEEFDIACESVVGYEWEQQRGHIAAKRLESDLGVKELAGDQHPHRKREHPCTEATKKRLVGPEFLPNLQYGVWIHAFAGDPETMVHYAKINTKDFPFGGVGDFSFPKELIAGPVVGPDETTQGGD